MRNQKHSVIAVILTGAGLVSLACSWLIKQLVAADDNALYLREAQTLFYVGSYFLLLGVVGLCIFYRDNKG